MEVYVLVGSKEEALTVLEDGDPWQEERRSKEDNSKSDSCLQH